jgi:hypothetical protein
VPARHPLLHPHATLQAAFFVNSAAHMWGYQTYETGERGVAACARSQRPHAQHMMCLLQRRLTRARAAAPTRPAGDLSTNNWWVSIVAFGEGWHNTHHAFPYSARHGLEWYEFDLTWLTIRGLQFLGLAWDLVLPTEKQLAAKARKAPKPASPKAADVKKA